jgi:hypothetical protein
MFHERAACVLSGLFTAEPSNHMAGAAGEISSIYGRVATVEHISCMDNVMILDAHARRVGNFFGSHSHGGQNHPKGKMDVLLSSQRHHMQLITSLIKSTCSMR